MARRAIEIGGEGWVVYPSGRVTANAGDEFGLVFEKGTGPDRQLRVTRYSPLGVKRHDVALAEIPEARLIELFRSSQSARSSPDMGYRRRAS